MVVGADLRAQAQQVLRNLRTAVEAGGACMADIVALRIYVVNYGAGSADVISSTLRECFPAESSPAATWIGVQSLAAEDFLIEIEATAVLE
jgi:enamine deaminase RidA (YjgF/YER057c/UK114 family)